MKKALPLVRKRILFAILLPVLGTGVLISLGLLYGLTPPLLADLKRQADTALRHATEMGISICDERFQYLMDLRLEDDPEMNEALMNEARTQIVAIDDVHPGIVMLVFAEDGSLMDASEGFGGGLEEMPAFPPAAEGPAWMEVGGRMARVHARYFPFWRWHVAGLVWEEDYTAPLRSAERIVRFGIFGVLASVVLVVLVVFYWRIDLPLQRIVDAARLVAGGELTPVGMKRRDEIGQVAEAFDAMVQSLSEDRKKIRTMMTELRDSEEQYRILTEYSLSLIVMIQKARVCYANQSALDTLGTVESDFLGRSPTDFVDPQDRRWAQRRIEGLSLGRNRVDRFECRCRTADGRPLWLEVLAALVLYREKPSVLLHAIDITRRKEEEAQRKELEEKLVRSRQMRAIGELAGGVAHDLNNILGSLVGYPDLLLLDLPEESSLRDPLITIKDSGQKAAAIVQDMLTLARRGVAVAEPMDLNALVRQYLKSPEHRHLLEEHPRVGVRTSLAPVLPGIVGSPVHFLKTLMNLVANAMEAIPDEGAVTIATGVRSLAEAHNGFEVVPEGDYATLAVTDDGVGISDADRKKIFEPFYTKKVMGRSGTGLGMPVVWGTVKDHGGYVDLISRSGNGTVFELFFPVSERPLVQKAETHQPMDWRGSERILVVDDVAEQRELARRMLEELGYRVFSASSGEEALEWLRTQEVDLVLLDMIMAPGGLDGCETYRKMLAIRPGQRAVIASGFAEDRRVRETRRLGAGAYLKKPYVLEALGRAVRSELDRE